MPEEKPKFKRTLHIYRVIMDLTALKGAFQKVNKKIAPDKDKGIYFDKAMYDLEKLIKKYKHLKEQYK